MSKVSELLDLLASDPNPDTRWNVAIHPDAPASALARLARDPDANVRARANEHPRTPEDAFSCENCGFSFSDKYHEYCDSGKATCRRKLY